MTDSPKGLDVHPELPNRDADSDAAAPLQGRKVLREHDVEEATYVASSPSTHTDRHNI